MTKTTTRYVNFQTLQARGPSANTVIKLMMACNDLSLANQSLSNWKNELSSNKKSQRRGAGMYFVRTQIAHLYEALYVVEEIKRAPILMETVLRCDSQTQKSFEELGQFLPNAPKRAEIEKLVDPVRNRLTFHYNNCGNLIEKEVSNQAGESGARMSSVTRGNTAHLWHFKIADDIVDDIVVHQFWGISRDANSQNEADKVVDRVHQIFVWFMDFSGEFIWMYCDT